MQQSKGLQLHISSGAADLAVGRALPGLLFAGLLLAADDVLAVPVLLPLLLGGAVLAVLPGFVPGRRSAALAGAILLLSLLAAALPVVQNSLRLLVNHLFAASEAKNRYAYTYLSVWAGSLLPARMMLTAALAALCTLSLHLAAGGCVLCWWLLLTAVQVFFGLSVSPVSAALLLAVPAAMLLHKGGSRALPAVLCLLLIVGALTAAAAPGVNAGLEARSEAVRDFVEQAARPDTPPPAPQTQEQSGTRRENRVQEQPLRPDDHGQQDAQLYQKQTEYEQNISKPKTVNYRKMLLLLLALVLVLVLPFLPFYLLGRRRELALARRADFDSPDRALAVRAMFSHVVRCLAALGVAEGNSNYSALHPALAALPGDYAAHFSSVLPLWQKAAYSLHPPDEAETQRVAKLLRETEALVESLADRKLRFRLHYIDCLLVKEAERP